MADNHQRRRHGVSIIHLLGSSEGVPGVVVSEQNDGLIQKQATAFQTYQCLQPFKILLEIIYVSTDCFWHLPVITMWEDGVFFIIIGIQIIFYLFIADFLN